ncbi:hypothetical protein GALMADRAFT_402006 [Galerina marginata CBS 339.88]|uniref:NACHT domain-containing protein n=1 Tax=Galerina marginata (strain CBS 339.88) TaxID=685588 RepID=A0A067TUS6_GALM3|nr:hypothetical protein GALMADRAFT_402006 [Galerina marginata CBS 339.88]
MFTGENVLVTGGNFTTVTVVEAKVDCAEKERREKAIETLHKNITSGAFHNAAERYDPPRCHEGTRKIIIKKIMDWVQSLDKKELFLWIYGPAGAGKSALAQTIAEICFELKLLAASFFFMRASPGRNSDKFLIPTLAYQLTISIPGIRNHVADAILEDPLILSRTLKDQFNTLIVKPLANLPPVEDSIFRPTLIIIDGLDECSEPNTQQYILSVLSSAALGGNPVQLSFLFASRPEYDIRNAFNKDSLNGLTRRLALDAKYQANYDIRHFLSSKFDEIKGRHPLKAVIPLLWPSPSDLHYLVEKSSGQFIYASTVIKFVESPRHRPMDRLDIILGLRIPGKNMPFAQLDALYSYIFSSMDDIESFTKVLSFFLAPSKYPRRDPAFIEEFLFCRPGDLQVILADLHSVFYVPTPGASEDLRLFHASLADFFMDKSRSGTWFMDASRAHATMAQHSISYIKKFPHDYEPFLVHLLNAYPTNELLQALACAHLQDFFKALIEDINTQDLVRPPAPPTRVTNFFRLLQNEFTADLDGCLHKVFQSLFDSYLQAKLQYYESDPDFYHLITGFILNECFTPYEKWHPFYILSETKGPSIRDCKSLFLDIDRNMLRFYDGNSTYRSAMVAFFTDSTRSATYYIGSTRWIDLAVVFVEYLGRSDRSNSGLGSTYTPQFERYASLAILEILGRLPGERRLAAIFRDKSLRKVIKNEDAVIKIEAYLKNCDSESLDSIRSNRSSKTQ